MKQKDRTMLDFEKEVAALINRGCMENESDTPDFILAEYLCDCLEAFNRATKLRTWWYRPEFDRPDNPLDNVYTRRETIDGSEEEAKAIKMEKDKAYEKLRQMPPNCS